MAHGDLQGVPGNPEVWHVDGRVFLRYDVPGTDPPVPLLYHVERPEILNDLFDDGEVHFDRQLTEEQARSMGAFQFDSLDHRTSSELLADLGDHPWDSFLAQIERESDVAPWLRDPEVVAHVADAWLRGDTPDLRQTQWWQERTPEERQWAEFVASNGVDSPAVQQRLEESRVQVRDALIDAGWPGDAPPDSLVAFLADRLTTGQWDQTRLQDEIFRHVDPTHPNASPFAGQDLPDNAELVSDGERFWVRTEEGDFLVTGEGQLAQLGGEEAATQVETPARQAGTFGDLVSQQEVEGRSALGGEEDVHRLMLHWLGPRITSLYNDEWIREWAGRIRRNPDARDQLVETLRAARQEHFPHWNENLTYEDRAPFYRQMYAEHAGFLPNEAEDDFFMSLMQEEKQQNISRMLFERGKKEGWAPVADTILGALSDAFGGQVRRAM